MGSGKHLAPDIVNELIFSLVNTEMIFPFRSSAIEKLGATICSALSTKWSNFAANVLLLPDTCIQILAVVFHVTW